jgi:formate dehydrogenase alpha subunit
MTALASGLGQQWDYESSQDIQNEIMKLLPGYYNLGQAKKPPVSPDAYFSNGYAAQVASRYVQPGTDTATDKPYRLIMGQLLYHSGKLSTQASGLINIAPNNGRLHMSPEDLSRLGLAEGGTVRLTSAKGSLVMAVQPNQSVMPGACFFPEHFNEPPVKDLMAVEVDPVTKVPTFKLTQVFVEKA